MRLKHRHLFLVVMVTALLLVGTRPPSAWADGSRSIYVVDIQKVITDSIMGKAARSNIEQELKRRELTLKASHGELDKLKEDIAKQQSLLSGSALDEKKELLRKRELEFTRTYQDQRQELERKNAAEISRVVDEIQAAIKELAKAKNYQFVVEKDVSLVVYADGKLDITDQVVKSLDKKKLG